VHKFRYNDDYKESDTEGEPRAVILGVSDDGRYRLWGPCRRDSLATSYHDLINLEEIFPTGSAGREPQKPITTSSLRQLASFHRDLSHRPSPGPTSSQAQDGGSEDVSGSDTAPSGKGQPPAAGVNVSENSAVQAQTSAQVTEPLVPAPTPLQKPTASGQSHALPDSLAPEGSRAGPSSMPHESATNIPETGSIDLQKTRDHAEEYLADLKDSSNFMSLGPTRS
jgi:hypothetical protein